MKIGQLTFHASHNYGSVLQAYALSQQLRLMGHETQFINLRSNAQKKAYEVIGDNEDIIHKIFHYALYYWLKKRYDEYERFITKVLPITQEEYHSTEELCECSLPYDAYVCGGDQIWNPVCLDFETAYYLQFLGIDDPALKISYATSFGITEFDAKTIHQIGQWLKPFDVISVREEQSVALIQSVSEKPVYTVCDPVLLLDRREWEQLSVRPKLKRPYILVYFLINNHGSRSLTEYLRKTLGYDVVIFNEYIRDFFKPYHKAYSASPEEFVGLFLNASFVYTNSFHGTAFATMFEKPFLTAIAFDQVNTKNNNDVRKIDFLKRLGLENRLYTNGFPTKKELLSIDFAVVREKLSLSRSESIEYLKNALNGRL